MSAPAIGEDAGQVWAQRGQHAKGRSLHAKDPRRLRGGWQDWNRTSQPGVTPWGGTTYTVSIRQWKTRAGPLKWACAFPLLRLSADHPCASPSVCPPEPQPSHLPWALTWPRALPATDFIHPHLFKCSSYPPLQMAKDPHTVPWCPLWFHWGTQARQVGWLRGYLLTGLLSPQGLTMFWSQPLPYTQSCGDAEDPYCYPGKRGKTTQPALLMQGLSGTGSALTGRAGM